MREETYEKESGRRHLGGDICGDARGRILKENVGRLRESSGEAIGVSSDSPGGQGCLGGENYFYSHITLVTPQ